MKRVTVDLRVNPILTYFKTVFALVVLVKRRSPLV